MNGCLCVRVYVYVCRCFLVNVFPVWLFWCERVYVVACVCMYVDRYVLCIYLSIREFIHTHIRKRTCTYSCWRTHKYKYSCCSQCCKAESVLACNYTCVYLYLHRLQSSDSCYTYIQTHMNLQIPVRIRQHNVALNLKHTHRHAWTYCSPWW